MSEQLPPQEADKQKLWGWWYESKKWQNKLHKSASHKALDIPEDMGDINAPKTMISHNGVNTLGLAAIVAAGLGGMYFLNQGKQPPPPAQPAVIQAPAATPIVPPVAPPVAATTPPNDRDYEIKFYQLQPDGTYKLINVDRKPQ